jgi:hypothetical protein
MASLLLLCIFVKDVVQILLVHLHEKDRWVILEIGQQGRPGALGRSLNLSDDVVLVRPLHHPAFLAVDGHAVGCPFSIYSALFISIVYFHHARLPTPKLTARSAIVHHWLRLCLLGRPPLGLVERASSMGLVDFYGDIERIHVPIGISCSIRQAFVLAGEGLVLR